MKMTLDEAIKHAEEVAKENREYAEDALDRYNLVPNDITKQEHDRCKQCAAEHRQLAEWLKDYKRLLEQEPILDKIRAKIENHCSIRKKNHCRYCSSCYSVMWVREILEIIDRCEAELKEDKGGD